MNILVRSLMGLVLALVFGGAQATIPVKEGEIDRIYPSNRVIVVDGDQYRVPESDERVVSFDQLREGLSVQITAGSPSQDGTRPVQTLRPVE